MIHHQTHSRPTESYFLTDVSECVVNWQIRRHEDLPELKYCGHLTCRYREELGKSCQDNNQYKSRHINLGSPEYEARNDDDDNNNNNNNNNNNTYQLNK